MTTPRLLTPAEADTLNTVAEHWLRLRDVEQNLGEVAFSMLRVATLRPASCQRQDIASVNWTVHAQLCSANAPIALILITRVDADSRRGRVLLLSTFGLALIGHALDTVTHLPLCCSQTVHAHL